MVRRSETVREFPRLKASGSLGRRQGRILPGAPKGERHFSRAISKKYVGEEYSMYKKDKNLELDLKDLKCAEPPKKIVGVIGGAKADREILNVARDFGREIARNGHILVCGGLGGVMEAACRGARESGGITVGVLPGHKRETANPFVTIPIVTAMSHARNAIIVRTADILIAIDGRYGTLSEIALAKALGKRVLGFLSWNEIPGVETVESVQEAITEINNL
jgi:uncharacterized protein (TIGR00725 family)